MDTQEMDLVFANHFTLDQLVLITIIVLEMEFLMMEFPEMELVFVTVDTTEQIVKMDQLLVQMEQHGTKPLEPVLVLLDFMELLVKLPVLVGQTVFVKMEILELVNVSVLQELTLFLALLLIVLKHVTVELVELVMMEIMELVFAFALKELLEPTVFHVQLVLQLLNQTLSFKCLPVMMVFKGLGNVSDFTQVLPLLQPFLV